MDDARYVLFQELKEKNATKRGAYHKVRGGGRTVRMPSDTLTRKERQALSGEVQTYRLGEPMTWQEFTGMPVELQEEYVRKLDERFNVGCRWLGMMFGVTDVTVSTWRRKHGMASKRNVPTKEQIEAYRAWIAQAREPAPVETPAEPEQPQESQDAASVDVLVAQHNDVAETLSELLRRLTGTGARITIEVVL